MLSKGVRNVTFGGLRLATWSSVAVLVYPWTWVINSVATYQGWKHFWSGSETTAALHRAVRVVLLCKLPQSVRFSHLKRSIAKLKIEVLMNFFFFILIKSSASYLCSTLDFVIEALRCSSISTGRINRKQSEQRISAQIHQSLLINHRVATEFDIDQNYQWVYYLS